MYVSLHTGIDTVQSYMLLRQPLYRLYNTGTCVYVLCTVCINNDIRDTKV